MNTWLDFAGSTRTDKELGEMIAVAIRLSHGTMKTTVLAHNEGEAKTIRSMLHGKHGAKLIDVQTAEELEAAHRAAVERRA